jgi:hypothetical protein
MSPVEAATHAQSSILLAAFDDYLRAAPDRKIEITFSLEHGFRVALHEEHVSKGESLRDAAAQVAQVLVLEGGAL